MFRYVGHVVHCAVRLATRRILREALASAIVTIVVTAAFTGFASRPEPPAPAQVDLKAAPFPVAVAAPRADVAAVSPAVPADELSKVWFDPNAVAPNPTGFRRAVAATVPSRPATHRKTAAARPAPSAPRPIVQASMRADEKAIGHGRGTPDALAQAPAPSDKRFRVWGVAPADYIPAIPTASSLMKGVKSVGTSVVGMMPSL